MCVLYITTTTKTNIKEAWKWFMCEILALARDKGRQ